MKTLSLFLKSSVFASLSIIAITTSSFAAQNVYKSFPADVMPELSEVGEYRVGVKTINVTYPELVTLCRCMQNA